MRLELEDTKKEQETVPQAKETAADPETETESLRDEIKLQQKKLEDMSTKEKLKYYVYYYKWHALIGLVVAIMAGSMIHGILTDRDEAFYCVLLNVDHALADTTEFANSFEDYAGIDKRHSKAVFDTSITTTGDNPIFAEDAYDSVTRLNAMYMAGQVDVTCADPDKIKEYEAEGNMLIDLSTLLDEATLEQLSSKELIYYAKDGTPLAVKITGSKVLQTAQCYDEGSERYACVIANAHHTELFDDFLAFLEL